MSANDPLTLDRKILGQLQEMDRLTGKGTLEKIVRLFLNSMPERLDSLERALDSGDFPEIRKLVHTMKSSAGNIGAMKLSSYCRAVEDVIDTEMATHARPILHKMKAEFAIVRDGLLGAGILKT